MASTIRRGAVLSTTAAMTLALAGLTPALAQAAGPSPRTTLDGAPAWTAHAARVGRTPAARPQHLTAVLGLRDADGAESLAAAVSDPSSATYGRFVSAATWRARFAPPQRRRHACDRLAEGQRLHPRRRAGQPPHGVLHRGARSPRPSMPSAPTLKTFTKDGVSVVDRRPRPTR